MGTITMTNSAPVHPLVQASRDAHEAWSRASEKAMVAANEAMRLQEIFDVAATLEDEAGLCEKCRYRVISEKGYEDGRYICSECREIEDDKADGYG